MDGYPARALIGQSIKEKKRVFYWFTPHYLWRRTFYLKEICDGGLCEVAKSFKDEACCILVVLLKCVGLLICVVCLYSHRVNSIS